MMDTNATKKILTAYNKAVLEHAAQIKCDPYYAHCCGGGRVPKPVCKYCTYYNGSYCTYEWNNCDESYCIPERDKRDEDDLCENYEWSGEWEEE